MGVQKGPWNMARVLTLKDKELAGQGADGRGRTARQRAQPGGSWEARRWVPIRARRGSTTKAAGRPLHAALVSSELAAVTAHEAVRGLCSQPPPCMEGGGRKRPGNSRGRDLIGPGRSASAPRVFKNSED